MICPYVNVLKRRGSPAAEAFYRSLAVGFPPPVAKKTGPLRARLSSPALGAPTTPSRGELLPALQSPIWEDGGNRLRGS